MRLIDAGGGEIEVVAVDWHSTRDSRLYAIDGSVTWHDLHWLAARLYEDECRERGEEPTAIGFAEGRAECTWREDE